MASLLIAELGVRGALLVVGAFLPLLTALTWRRLRALDTAPVAARELALLRSVSIFAPLSVPALERLASRLVPMRMAGGERVFSQGDAGDRFYVIAAGEVEVSVDGEPVRREGPGEHFGEIALLRDTPRTATVTACSEVELYALEGDEFIAAVTGHSPSREAADAVIGARLARARPELASI